MSDTLARTLESLGLSPYESRVLVALLKAGSAGSPQLARLADVPRTSAYSVLASLADRAVVYRLPGEGPAIWSSHGSDQVLDCLADSFESKQGRSMHKYRQHVADARRLLEQTIPAHLATPSPQVQIIRDPAKLRHAYQHLIEDAQDELLLFDHPPYIYASDLTATEALARGVRVRTLHHKTQWRDQAAKEFRFNGKMYHRAGLESRWVDDLPIGLIVADRQAALVCTPRPIPDEERLALVLLVSDCGMVEALALGFEGLWTHASPLGVPSFAN